jgi:hypothetical protein
MSKQPKKIIEKFMKDTGYTDITQGYSGGIRKDHKRNPGEWTWKDPTEMLRDFIRWQKKQGEE